ncbi:MAG: Ig-like domain repeat protein [Clostridium sp.]|nr:Ig-like domain repeat protein [Clostridium sp.]
MFYTGMICSVIFFLLSVICFIRNNVAGIIRSLAAGGKRGGRSKRRKRILRLLAVSMLLGMLIGAWPADRAAAQKQTVRGYQEEMAETVPGGQEEPQTPIIEISGIQEQYADDEGKYFCNQEQRLMVYVQAADLDTGKCRVHVLRDQESDSFWQETDWSADAENPCRYQKEIVLAAEGEYTVSVEAETADGIKAEQTCLLVIDKTAPEIFDICYYDADGLMEKKYGNIYGNRVIRMEFTAEDRYSGVVEKGIQITIGKGTLRNGDEGIYPAHRLADNRYYVYIPPDTAVSEFDDVLTVWAQDLLENIGSKTVDRIIYSKGAPSIRMACDKNFSLWTNEDVTFHTTVSDYAAGLKEIIYTVNKKVVKRVEFDRPVYTFSCDVTADESAEEVIGYTVEVEAVNNCGNCNRMQRRVYVDKEKPQVRFYGVQDGMHYHTDQMLKAEISDVSYAGTITKYVIKRKWKGRVETIPVAELAMEAYSGSYSYRLSEEGEYRVHIITTDGAGNRTVSDTLQFVIDKTPPKLSVSGVEEGSMNASAVTLQFACEEDFPASDKLFVDVKRRMDGDTEEKRLGGFVPDGTMNLLQHTFVQDGAYDVTFTAADRAGNRAESKTIHFYVDSTKPKLSISGTENYQQWSEAVTVVFGVEETYYRENRVTITGTRRDIDGRETALSLPRPANIGKNSSLSHMFSEEGIYHLKICSTDGAGNQAEKEIHFVIDCTAPQIDGPEAYQGKYCREFRLADGPDEIFKDLTVVSYCMLLNGEEYNGTETITCEGKYNLYIEAEDELGHSSSKSVEFIVDHTAPKVIFTSVENGQKVYEGGSVTWALADSGDEITGVRVNGKEYNSGTKRLDYSQYGIYRIEIDCVDKAGNTATRTLDFTYSRPLTATLVIGVVGILVAVMGIMMFVRIAVGRKKLSIDDIREG